MPAKPTKFGIKVWVRADPNNGYVNEFSIYTGKSAEPVVEEGFSLGERAVKSLVQKIEGKNHHVYMDNYFSSPKHFDDLLEKSIFCCGTVRLNRKSIPTEFRVKTVVKNQGNFLTMQKGKLTATSWKDKKQVNFLATNVDPTEVDVVQRREEWL